MKDGIVIKIVQPVGYRVHRLEFTRRTLAIAAVLALAIAGMLAGFYVWKLQRAQANVVELRSLTNRQRSELRLMDVRAGRIDAEMHAIERQNEEIRRLMGVRGSERVDSARRGDGNRTTMTRSLDFQAVAANVERLRSDAKDVGGDEAALRDRVLSVLNMRRIASLGRARLLANIPSINPGGPGVGIRSAYGWRSDPWPEFHQGVDLDVDYGDPVYAAAAGTVVAAGYDGGYGIKVDIDHGNGYHTWYCHLSSAAVAVGEHVRKAQEIALVGSTGASTGPHLHYQIMLDGSAIDPAPYLAGVPRNVLASLR